VEGTDSFPISGEHSIEPWLPYPWPAQLFRILLIFAVVL
jgi:hypothetical protein